MGDMGEVFNAMRDDDKERRERNLAKANPVGWKHHTEHHWSRQLNGKRLDYWPSRNKFMYEDRVMTGSIDNFIKKREKQ